MSGGGMMTPDVSIVVVSHNHRAALEKCLDSLHALPDRAAFQVTLIDNTGADGAAEWTREHYSDVIVRRNAVCRGFAANANAGIRQSVRCPYVLLLNPDVICLPGLLERLIAFLDAHPEAAIAAPQLFCPDGASQPNVRRFPTPSALALRALRVDALWKSRAVRCYLMHGESPVSTEVDWVTGAALMVRRTAIEDVGLLDENYFLYWEDLDWCYRMRQAGWTVHRIPEARAIHVQAREGVRRPFSRAGRSQLAGAVRFFRKYGWNAGRAA